MANVSWTHNPPVWTASVDGNAVCNIKGKDIGGCAATWVGDRLWPPPAHLPKAITDRLNAEISKLRGQLEVNSHEIELAQQRQRDLYADLDGRMRKLEGGASATKPADAAVAATATPVATATPNTATPPTDGAAELKAYEAALELSKSGKHKDAIEAFEKFLETYPASKYAAPAQYWIGYSYFSQKNYKAAIAGQQKLIKLYPDHHKVPDAMYNLANSQIQLSEIDNAKQTLREIVSKYPLSDAAPLAKKRLAVLESVKSKN